MRKYESEGKYTVRNLVKNKAIALELAEMYVKNRYGHDAEEEKNHTKSWNYQQVGLLKAPLNQTKLLVGFLLQKQAKMTGEF